MKTVYMLPLAALMALASCDNIDEADRFIPVERPESDKVILIEEFTGARCVNCPTGAATVADLHEQYPGQVVAVSLYPEQMASLTAPITTDLRTTVASDIFSAFDGTSKGLPAAMFDRSTFNGSVLQLTVTQWPSFVYDLLSNQTSPVNIALETAYNESSRELTVNYNVDFLSAVNEEVSFQLYITEDGIESMQLTPTGMDTKYINNHVLRAALNGTWGTSLGSLTLAGQQKSGSATVTLKDDWKAENCNVVGFLARTGDKTVLQAAETHVVPAAE